VRTVNCGTVFDHALVNVSTHGTITAPLINLAKWCFAVDVINTRLSGFILLVGTEAVSLVLSANVYGCPKVHKAVDVLTVVSQ